MNGSDFGLGILGLGELSRLENASRREGDRAAAAEGILSGALDKAVATHQNYVFRAKGQIHGFRAYLHGHRVAEDMLIAALKAENANHPLASREAVDAAVLDERARALVNPEVIKKTYPDGKLPDGVIIPPDRTVGVS